MTDLKQEAEEVLKPCPFCGGEAMTEESSGIRIIRCGDGVCEAQPRILTNNWERSMLYWNTRPIEAKQAEEIERLQDIINKFIHDEDPEPITLPRD